MPTARPRAVTPTRASRRATCPPRENAACGYPASLPGSRRLIAADAPRRERHAGRARSPDLALGFIEEAKDNAAPRHGDGLGTGARRHPRRRTGRRGSLEGRERPWPTRRSVGRARRPQRPRPGAGWSRGTLQLRRRRVPRGGQARAERRDPRGAAMPRSGGLWLPARALSVLRRSTAAALWLRPASAPAAVRPPWTGRVDRAGRQLSAGPAGEGRS